MLDELKKRVDQGFVAARRNGRLTIFNYTKYCMFQRAWDDITIQARGLVLDDQGRVFARPWAKFFNLNERPHTRLEALPKETPELSEKLDGSMIVVFYDDVEKRWIATTRGGWDNEQAKYANKWLVKNGLVLEPGKTYIFELVAPWNRVVVPYAKEEMILLGIVDTESGRDATYAEITTEAHKRGLKPVGFQSKPIEELDLADPTVQFKEGYVARFSNGLRVKLKYAQYLSLHKVMTGLSVKGIWETLSTGSEPTFDNVPDEFMDWYEKQRDGLKDAYSKIEKEALAVFNATPPQPTRKDYAKVFGRMGAMAPILFLMLDKQPYAEIIWDRIKPKGKSGTFQVDDE